MSITFDEFTKSMMMSSRRLFKKMDKLTNKTASKMKMQAVKNAHIYPKKRTGRLVSSIQGEVLKSGGDFEILVFADTDVAPYAEFVEFGTSRMKPRLYIKRAVEKVQPSFEKAVDDLLSETLEGR